MTDLTRYAHAMEIDNETGKPMEKVAVAFTDSNAREPFSGTANVTHTFTTKMNGFTISNDGTADLTFTINTYTFTVKAGEVFSDNFDPFTTVTVTTTVAFRAYGRG